MDFDGDDLPPPPPLPEHIVPMKADKAVPGPSSPPKEKKPPRIQMARPGLARRGNAIQLASNHFKVDMRISDSHFVHYSVVIKYEDGKPVDGKSIGMRVIDRLHQTYSSELGNKDTAYDGEKSLFTIGALPQNINEFTVVLDEMSSSRRSPGNNSPSGNDSPEISGAG